MYERHTLSYLRLFLVVCRHPFQRWLQSIRTRLQMRLRNSSVSCSVSCRRLPTTTGISHTRFSDSRRWTASCGNHLPVGSYLETTYTTMLCCTSRSFHLLQIQYLLLESFYVLLQEAMTNEVMTGQHKIIMYICIPPRRGALPSTSYPHVFTV